MENQQTVQSPEVVMEARLEQAARRLNRFSPLNENEGTRNYRRKLARRRKVEIEVDARRSEIAWDKYRRKLSVDGDKFNDANQRELYVEEGVEKTLKQEAPRPAEIMSKIRTLAKIAKRIPTLRGTYVIKDLSSFDLSSTPSLLTDTGKNSRVTDALEHTPNHTELIRQLLGDNAQLLDLTAAELAERYGGFKEEVWAHLDKSDGTLTIKIPTTIKGVDYGIKVTDPDRRFQRMMRTDNPLDTGKMEVTEYVVFGQEHVNPF